MAKYRYQICRDCAGNPGVSGEKIVAKIDAKIKSERKKVVEMAKKNKTIEGAGNSYINCARTCRTILQSPLLETSLIDQILDLGTRLVETVPS